MAYFDIEKVTTGKTLFVISDTYNSDCGICFENRGELEQFIKDTIRIAKERMGWDIDLDGNVDHFQYISFGGKVKYDSKE